MLKKNPDKAANTVLFLIVLLGMGLRLIGIKHGFPFIFHPDEPAVIRAALALRFAKNPGHFDWPHFYIYLNYFIYMGFAKLRYILASYDMKEFVQAYFPLMWNDTLIYYFITRVTSAVIGALTVIPIYKTGKELFNKKVGLLAALTFSVIPFHVWHSHYALPDVPMVFFLSWALYFSAKIYRKNDVGYYAKAGLLIGLAASSKYNGGLAAIMVPLAHVFRVVKDENEDFLEFWSLVNLAVSGLFAIVGFLLGTPYALMDYRTFIRTDGPKGALWQFTNVGSVYLSERIPVFISNLRYKLASDTGYVILIGFFLVFIMLLLRTIRKIRKPENTSLWLLLIPGLFLLVYISGFRVSRSHYFLIAYPFISLIFGYLLFSVLEYFQGKWKFLSYLFVLFLLTVPFYYTLRGVIRFNNGDTRNILHTWFQENLIPGDVVVYENNNIEPVRALTNNTFKKGAEYLWEVPSGYLVYSYDNPKELIDYGMKAEPYKNRLSRIFTVNKEYFLGPDIIIYKIAPLR